MLKRNKRIPGREDIFGDIKENGKELKGTFLIIRRKSNGTTSNRYATNISKKLDKSAVKRNRLRRQIYEIIRLGEKSDKIPQTGDDIIIFTRKAILNQTYTNLEKIVLDSLNQL